MVINQVLTNQNQTNYLPIILEYSANLKLYWIQNENQLPVTAFDTLLKTTLLLTINHINNKFEDKKCHCTGIFHRFLKQQRNIERKTMHIKAQSCWLAGEWCRYPVTSSKYKLKEIEACYSLLSSTCYFKAVLEMIKPGMTFASPLSLTVQFL